jgi:hypothetical protein
MKTTHHPAVHLSVHRSANRSWEERRGCAWRDSQFGRGQNTELGWSDPTFGSFQPPKDLVGSLQPSV